MAFELSVTAELLSQQVNIKSQIILEIEGFDSYIFGAVPIGKVARYGEDDIAYGDAGLYYGGTVEDTRSRDLVSLSGTTYNIKQQLLQDKGGTNSISRVRVNLIDKNGLLTEIFAPKNVVEDLLASRAQVYIAFQGGAHPEDSIKIFDGIIDAVNFGAGDCNIEVSHPEALKRQEIFIRGVTNLNGAINDTQTTITLDATEDLILPGDSLRTYVRIDDEIIEYTGISGFDLTGCVRGSLTTLADSHDDDADVESFYRLQGEAIDLALKLMLSGPDEYYRQNVPIIAFNQITAVDSIENTVIFKDENAQEKYGLTPGDLISVSGAANGANNFIDAVIIAFGQVPTASYAIISGPTLVNETNSSAQASLKSQYNILPLGCGCGMTPEQVDVKQHQELKVLLNTATFTYDYYIKDTVTARDFINEKIYFPSGLYSVPRKGRSSLNVTLPPLLLSKTKFLTLDTVKKPEQLRIGRSINKNFYNAVVYKYNEDSLEEKFLAGNIEQSARSTNIIKTGNKPLTIEVGGLRPSADTSRRIAIQSRRFLDRYQFGAEGTDVDVPYKVGFNVEVADTVVFGNEDLKVADTTNGTRDFSPRIMEVVNKSMNIKTGEVKLNLLDTAFNLSGRYSVISPSSIVGAGATLTEIPLKKSFSTGEFDLEQEKWVDHVGERVLIRNADYSIQYIGVIDDFDPTRIDVLILEDSLPAIPPEGFFVDVPQYAEDSADTDKEYKDFYAYADPCVDVVSGTDNFTFEVGVGDIDKFFIGSYVQIHNDDYTLDSGVNNDIAVEDITGNIITVDTDLGFTPASGHFVELIGFRDEGYPYRYV